MRFALNIMLQSTALAIVGFVLLFMASKTQGIVAFIGRLLAVWVYFVAALIAAAGVMAFFQMGPFWAPGPVRYVPNRYYQAPPVQRTVPQKQPGHGA
jgi:hypothetical protein